MENQGGNQAFVLNCPSGHRLKIPGKFAGRRVVCPVCAGKVDVPNGLPSPDGNVIPSGTQMPPPPAAAPKESPLYEPSEPVRREPSPQEEKSRDPSLVAPELRDFKPPAPAPDPAPTAPASIEPPSIQPPAPTSTPVELNEPPHIDLESALVFPGITPSGTQPTETPSWSNELASDEFAVQIVTDRELEESPIAVFVTDPMKGFRSGLVRLSIAAILVAVVCSVPSLVEQFRARSAGIRNPDAWSFFVLLMVGVQTAVALFAARIPDWSTTWVLCAVATLWATAYAAALAVTMFATQSHTLLRRLGLLDEAFQYRAQPWCFAMMCGLLVLALFCGRHSFRWQQFSQASSEHVVAG